MSEQPPEQPPDKPTNQPPITPFNPDDKLDFLLRKDLRNAAIELSPGEVRFAVDFYYQLQDFRKAAVNMIRASQKGKDDYSPHELISWLADRSELLEKQIPPAMEKWNMNRRSGRWAMSQYGIGPVLTAGLLAYLDITEAPTVGHFWSFCGLNPDAKWEKGGRRPYCLFAKVLCWKVGDSFVKQSGAKECVYGAVWLERKALEIQRNESGAFADQAEEALKRKWKKQDTTTLLWYKGCLNAADAAKIRAAEPKTREALTKELAGEPGSGVAMLPPGRIDLRARRVAVKLFLSHLHYVMHECEFGVPPAKPFILTQPGHTHFKAPPGWPCE